MNKQAQALNRQLGAAKSRAILLLTIVIILVGLIFGYLAYRRTQAGKAGQATVAGTPAIKALPGVGDPSPQVVKTIVEGNVQAVQEAKEKGTAAVPTIVRPTYEGPAEFGGEEPPQCTPSALARARGAGVSALELRCAGCSVRSLLAAGFAPGQLLNAGFSAKDLRQAGDNVANLRKAGYTAAELRRAGYSCAELLAGGFTPAEVAQAGYSEGQLQTCMTPNQLNAAGVGTALPKDFPKSCDVSALKAAHDAGVSAAEIKNRLKCSAAAMKAAGYTAKQLKAAGYTARQLKDAGYTAKQLKDAGFTAGELRQAGFTPKALLGAGFTPKELRDAGYSAEDLAKAGVSAKQLKDAGFSNGDILRAGLKPPAEAKAAFPTNCSEVALRRAHDVGISATEIKEKLGCSAVAMKDAGYSARELKDAGYTARQLKNAGFSPADLRAAGFSPKALRAAGFTAGQLRAAGLAEPTGVSTVAGLPTTATGDPESQAQATLQAIERRQAQQVDAQQEQAALEALRSAMQTQAQQMWKSWIPTPPQKMVVGEPLPQKKMEAVAVSATPSAIPLEERQALREGRALREATGEFGRHPGFSDDELAKLDSVGTNIKAGTIMFAVMDTSVDSDQPGPILATIVDGELTGAKLIGRFTRINKKLVLNFSTVSIPHQLKSMALNTVAIDPKTARTALASSVNSHYLLRYGSLFASSFLSGLSEAIQNAGSMTTVTGTGTTITSHPNLDTHEKLLVALGNVGTQYANVMGSNFNVPPTVRLCKGKGVGILFMSDFEIPPLKPVTGRHTVRSRG